VQLRAATDVLVPFVRHFNRRTLDVLAARVYFYHSLAYERADNLQAVRATLLELHCTAVLNHDEFGQEVLLNLLLRNYLHYSLYDQADKLRAQSQRPETTRSNQQHCRYLFYLGKIRAVQLEYTEAKECLLQATRKARALACSSAMYGFALRCLALRRATLHHLAHSCYKLHCLLDHRLACPLRRSDHRFGMLAFHLLLVHRVVTYKARAGADGGARLRGDRDQVAHRRAPAARRGTRARRVPAARPAGAPHPAFDCPLHGKGKCGAPACGLAQYSIICVRHVNG
jgi:hypothetical protein